MTMTELRAQGAIQDARRRRRDWSKVFALPTVQPAVPMAPEPPGLKLPLFDYQRRSLHRMLEVERDGVIELPLGSATRDLPSSTGPRGRSDGQAAAVTKRCAFRGGVVADEVGMGKTALLISLFLASPRPAAGGGQRAPGALVITPGHLCAQWASEIRKFTDRLRVATVADPVALARMPKERIDAGCLQNDVVITSLDIVLATAGGGGGAAAGALLAQPWQRVVYDECHEVIAKSSVAQQKQLEYLARQSQNCWCVSGTPFPHWDDSMYGIHQLLGVDYRMHIVNSPFARNQALPADHPFTLIKRRFYVRNTKESVRAEWSRIIGPAGSEAAALRENTIRLDMTLVERGFYDEQARKLGEKAKGSSYYAPVYRPLRQLCDHPAAATEWAERLSDQGGMGGGPVLSIDELRVRFVEQKQAELKQLAAAQAKAEAREQAARHALALVRQLQSASGGGGGGGGPVLGDVVRADLQRLKFAASPARYRLVNRNGGVALKGKRAEVEGWLLRDVCSWEAREHFLGVTRSFIQHSQTVRDGMARDATKAQSELRYFRDVLSELDPGSTAADAGSSAGATAAAVGRECIICSEDQLKIVSVAPCGHYFCTQCLQKWLQEHGDCPTCRAPLAVNDVMCIHLELSASDDAGSALTRQFGTKPAALVRFLQDELRLDPTARCIVFSQWHEMLALMRSTLIANQIKVASVDSDEQPKNEAALADFRATRPGTPRVLMLSMEHAAAGANLQCANHVILLEPPGTNPAHGVAQETQAIGRAVRLGQRRAVTVTRIVINDTIEAKLHESNAEQRVIARSSVRQSAAPSSAPAAAAAAAAAAGHAPTKDELLADSAVALREEPSTAGQAASMPYDGDIQAAMRAGDRTAIRALLAARDTPAPSASSAAAAAAEPAHTARTAHTGGTGAEAVAAEPGATEAAAAAAAGTSPDDPTSSASALPPLEVVSRRGSHGHGRGDDEDPAVIMQAEAAAEQEEWVRAHTVAQLKEALAARGVELPRGRPKKAVLVDLYLLSAAASAATTTTTTTTSTGHDASAARTTSSSQPQTQPPATAAALSPASSPLTTPSQPTPSPKPPSSSALAAAAASAAASTGRHKRAVGGGESAANSSRISGVDGSRAPGAKRARTTAVIDLSGGGGGGGAEAYSVVGEVPPSPQTAAPASASGAGAGASASDASRMSRSSGGGGGGGHRAIMPERVALDHLQDMGFSRVDAKQALQGSGGDVATAVSVLERDMREREACRAAAAGAGAGGGARGAAAAAAAAADAEGMGQLLQMGFQPLIAERALRASGGDLGEAITRLLYRTSVL
jgi:superfamily II DNA or RNA helicase